MSSRLDEITTLLARAQTLESIGRHREAVAELHRALRIDPNSDRALCSLAYNLYRIGDFKAARDYAERAIAANPDNEWAYRLRSTILRSGKLLLPSHNRLAVEDALTAVRIAPNEKLAWYTLTDAQLKAGQVANAARSAETLLHVAPEWALTHCVLSSVAFHEGRNGDAEAHVREALRLDPLSGAAMNQLGTVLTARVELEEGIEAYYRAVQMNPQDDAARTNFYRSMRRFCGGVNIRLWMLVTVVLAAYLAIMVARVGTLPTRIAGVTCTTTLTLLLSTALAGDQILLHRRRAARLSPEICEAYRAEARRRNPRWWMWQPMPLRYSRLKRICR